MASLASTGGSSAAAGSSGASKFGKNLFKSKLADTGAQLETPLSLDDDAAAAQSPPDSGLSPDDYDYNPFYIGNAASQQRQPPPQPPTPAVANSNDSNNKNGNHSGSGSSDEVNPYYVPPTAVTAPAATAAPTRRQVIDEMLQEMKLLSAKPKKPPPKASSSASFSTASVSFCCGGGGAGGSDGDDDDKDDGNKDSGGGGYATFSVKVGGNDNDDDNSGMTGTACGSDDPMEPGVVGFSTAAAAAASSGATATGASATSASVGCDASDFDGGGGGFASQTSEAAIRVETRLLRFLRDPAVTEFRFEGRLQPAERRAVRWFAKERGLFFKEVALRSHERAYVVKKPFAMAREQQAKQRESERQAAKAEASRLLAEIAGKKDSSTDKDQQAGDKDSASFSCTGGGASFSVKAGCDATASTVACSDAWMETDPTDGPELAGEAASRQRRDNWCQTISEDNFLCYVCQAEVPLVIKPVHIGACLAQLRLQLRQDRAEADEMCERLVRRQAELKRHKRPGDKRKVAMREAIEADKAKLEDRLSGLQQRRALLEGSSGGGGHRSSAGEKKTQQQQPQQQHPQKQPFEDVNGKDFQRLLVEARQLDRACGAAGCGVAGAGCCDACGRRFCAGHLEAKEHRCRGRGSGGGGGGGAVSSAPTKFERNRLRQGLRDRLAMMAERRK